MTSDEVADAVVEYGRALANHGLRDIVDIPVVLDGAVTHCRLTLEPSIAWATISIPGSAPGTLNGGANTAGELRERTSRLLEDAISNY